jgi:aryl-alcohol dehydrogenase-like predicted oxidoreductase
MRLRNLGTTDLKVSELCLGTMGFGWTADERSSFAAMDAFVEAGGNFLDTADVYSFWVPGHRGGEAEEIIGRWLKARGSRDRLVIATKVRGRVWEGPDGEGLSRSHIERAVEDSLRRLQVESLDLYQCHWPDDNTPIEETLSVFAELINSGKVRYVGASNFPPTQLDAALKVAKEERLPRFVSLQPPYNLVRRAEFEKELAPICQREGLAVIPYGPLASGFLTGKYRQGQPLPESQRAEYTRDTKGFTRAAASFMTEQGFTALAALENVARAHGTTMGAAALAWLLAKPVVTAPIIGVNSQEQFTDLLPAVAIHLRSDELDLLDAASAGM